MDEDEGDLNQWGGAFVPVPQPGQWPEQSSLGRFSKRGNPAWEAAASALRLGGQYPAGFSSFKCVLSANRGDDSVHPELPSAEFPRAAALCSRPGEEQPARPGRGGAGLQPARSAGGDGCARGCCAALRAQPCPAAPQEPGLPATHHAGKDMELTCSSAHPWFLPVSAGSSAGPFSTAMLQLTV